MRYTILLIDNLSIIYNHYPHRSRVVDTAPSSQPVGVVHYRLPYNLLGFFKRAFQPSAACVEVTASVEELGSHFVARKLSTERRLSHTRLSLRSSSRSETDSFMPLF